MGLWKAIKKTLVSRPSRKGKSKLTNERGTCEENENGNNPIPKETTGIEFETAVEHRAETCIAVNNEEIRSFDYAKFLISRPTTTTCHSLVDQTSGLEGSSDGSFCSKNEEQRSHFFAPKMERTEEDTKLSKEDDFSSKSKEIHQGSFLCGASLCGLLD